MALIGSNNALGWAHFRLRGGWPRTLMVTLGATAFLAILIVGSVQANPKIATNTLWGWTTGLLVLQTANFVLFTVGRINAVIRQDVQSRMIESHRMMPIEPAEAVTGYLLGAALQPLVFAAGIYVLGAVTSGMVSMSLARWTFANIVVLAFSVFLWVMSSYASFSLKVGSMLVFLPMFSPLMTDGDILIAVPGLTVLLSPLIGRSVFDFRTGAATLPPAYTLSFMAQAAFIAIFFIAAMRKYRSSNEIGIDTFLGMAVVIVWALITILGMRAWEDIRPQGWQRGQVGPPTRIISSVALGMFFAIASVSANALERVRWRRHEALRDPAPMRKPISAIYPITAAMLALVAIAPAAPTTMPLQLKQLILTAILIVLFLTGLYFIFLTRYALNKKAVVFVIVWLMLTLSLPIIADYMRYVLTDGFNDGEAMTVFSSCSPIGALILIWKRPELNLWPGIFVQALMCGVGFFMWVGVPRQSDEANLVPDSAPL